MNMRNQPQTERKIDYKPQRAINRTINGLYAIPKIYHPKQKLQIKKDKITKNTKIKILKRQ
jgi:hypothetical protein